MEAEIADLQGARRGHITVAAVESVATSLLPDIIQTVRRRAPRVTFTVQIMGSFDIPAAIDSGDVDVGIVFALRKLPELHQVFLAQFQLGTVCGRTIPSRASVPSRSPLASAIP